MHLRCGHKGIATGVGVSKEGLEALWGGMKGSLAARKSTGLVVKTSVKKESIVWYILKRRD